MGGLRAAAGFGAGLVAAFALSGCGERAEPTAATVAIYPVTVQGATGAPVSLSHQPTRVAALTPGATEILAALGASDRVVARPASARRGAAPKAKVVIDERGRFLTGELMKLRPDLLIGSPAFSTGELKRAAGRSGARIYVAPESSIRDVERSISEIGLMVDEPIAARRIISKIETARSRVTARVAGTRLVSVFVDLGFFTTVSDRSLVGDMIRTAHGRNVAGPTPEPGPLDPSELVRLAPRVYIASSESDTSLRDLRKNHVTRHLAAVRSGRFGTIPSAMLRPGPRIWAGLAAIARVLHPRAFR